jgi:AraC family transcriptional regulator
MSAANTYLGTSVAGRDTDLFALEVSRYAAGAVLPYHHHANAYFCIVLRGSLIEEHDIGRDRLTAGSVVFHPEGDMHANHFGSDAVCLNLALAGGRLGSEVPTARAAWSDPYAGLLGTKLYAQLRNGGTATDVHVSVSKLRGLLVRGQGPDDAGPAWIDNLRESVDRAPSGRTVSALALEAGFHPAHVARVFRQRYGVSLGAYLRLARILRCVEALSRSADSLARIAGEAGFFDQSHMTNAVRSSTGMTPAQLKRFMRNDARFFQDLQDEGAKN